MTSIATSTRPGESLMDRALRLRASAGVFRASADDARAENERAYERAVQAQSLADHAEYEYELALAAWEHAGRPA